jgi:hypothetical protein
MYTSLRALMEPRDIESLIHVTYMLSTALVFGYLAFVVLFSPF